MRFGARNRDFSRPSFCEFFHTIRRFETSLERLKCANSCHWRAAYERPRSTLCCPSRLGLRTDGKRKKAVFGRRRRMRQEQSSCWGRVRTRTAAEQLLNAGPMRLVAKEPSDRGRVRDYG